MKKLLLVLVLALGCAHEIKQRPSDPIVILKPIETTVRVLPAKGMPEYILPADATEEFREARFLLARFGNSDEFWNFVAAKRKSFAHTAYTKDQAIAQFRKDLARGDQIPIQYFTKWYKTRSIGAWNGIKILQNRNMRLTVIERAGHLLHETTHKYDFRHIGNYADRNNNQNSFPYAVGYDFEEFLATKKEQLAVK